MTILKETKNISCNFCNRGELNPKGVGLIYPYTHVYTFQRENGGGLCASICSDCLLEFAPLINDIKQLKP